MARPVGIIFDFDGTIVISEPLHMKAWVLVGEELGKDVPTQVLEDGVGATDEDVARDLSRLWQGSVDAEFIHRRKCEIYESLAGQAPFVEGFERFLAAIKEHRIPVGIATSASRGDIAPVLDGRALRDKFDAILSVEDVQNPKPAPEIYLRVAQQIGVAPEHCIGFEDSPKGATAVRAAGMRLVGMLTSFDDEKLGPLTLGLPHYPDPRELFQQLEIST